MRRTVWLLGLLLLIACQLPLAPLPTTNTGSWTFRGKKVAKTCMEGFGPALLCAVRDATGVGIRQLPITPERVWRAWRETDLKYSC